MRGRPGGGAGEKKHGRDQETRSVTEIVGNLPETPISPESPRGKLVVEALVELLLADLLDYPNEEGGSA